MTSIRTVDLSGVEWIKSSYSQGDGGECVETSRSLLPSHLVPVRDSKVPSGPVLTVSVPAWSAFLASL